MSDDIISDYLKAFSCPVPMVYCDYIAHRIRQGLLLHLSQAPGDIIASVGHVRADLHPEGGYLLTCTKRVEITDRNGKRYLVTIEEVKP